MARDNGGIIGVTNNPTSSTATGVWSIESQYQARVGDTWPQRALFASNAVRYNSSSSDYLRQVEGTAATSGTTYTFFFFFKRSKLGTDQTIFYNYINGSNFAQIYFRGPQKDIRYFDRVSGGDTCVGTTSPRLFEDSTGWMNVVLSVDTTQSASADKVKFYINGEYLAFNFDNVPSTSQVLTLGSAGTRTVGANDSGGNNLDGYLSETILIDGQALDGTSFGTTNSDGVWVPIPYIGTYGNIGFNLQYGDAAALGTDSSPNANTFTPSNLTSVDQSTDYPEVNNATLNPLIYTDSTISEGNLQYTSPGSNPVFGSLSSIGMGQGKWYGEVNYVAGSNHYLVLGVADETFNSSSTSSSYDLGKSGTTSSIAYVVNTGAYRINNSNTSWGSAGGDGQIIMWAIDKVNNKIYFGVNGVWGASSNPASNSGGIPTTALDSSTSWFIGCTNDTGSTETVAQFNFGSPPYAISSGNADANGYGNFEYAVPSGYYALNTANLAEFG